MKRNWLSAILSRPAKADPSDCIDRVETRGIPAPERAEGALLDWPAELDIYQGRMTYCDGHNN